MIRPSKELRRREEEIFPPQEFKEEHPHHYWTVFNLLSLFHMFPGQRRNIFLKGLHWKYPLFKSSPRFTWIFRTENNFSEKEIYVDSCNVDPVYERQEERRGALDYLHVGLKFGDCFSELSYSLASRWPCYQFHPQLIKEKQTTHPAVRLKLGTT